MSCSIGVITLGGHQVGVVTYAVGEADKDTPDLYPDLYDESLSGHPPGSEPEPRGPGGVGEYRSGPTHHYPGHGDHSDHTEHRSRDSADVGDIPYSPSGNPFDRARFAKELKDKPWLREKMAHISLGENQDPRANLAVIETMMNRAVVRGTSLEAQVRRHKSSGVDEHGYYAGWAPSFSFDKRAMFEHNLGEALGEGGKGQSNISRYATDNSSGGFADGEAASGRFNRHMTINGESFFSPGSAEPAFRDRWQMLNRRASETPVAAAPAAPTEAIAPPSMGAATPDRRSAIDAPYRVAERMPSHWIEGDEGNPIIDYPSFDPIDRANRVQPNDIVTPPAPEPGPVPSFPHGVPTPGDKHDPKNKPRDPSFSIPQDYNIT
jgi:hypothetical protein